MSEVTTRDALEAALRKHNRGVISAGELADALLASGAVIDAATLAEDETLVRDVSARWGAEATYVAHNVQHVLRHLSAALSERTS